MRDRAAKAGFLIMLLIPAWAPEAVAADAGSFDPSLLSRWIVRVDATGSVLHTAAEIEILGNKVPGGALSINNSATVTADVSYFFTPNLAANLYTGLPARGVIRGSGSLTGFGALATAMYGPVILSAEYHATHFGAFKPYMGVGAGYVIFLDTHDVALSNVHVPNAWGAAFSMGADYDIDGRWMVSAYGRQMLLATTVAARFLGAAVTSKTTVNPTLFGLGIGYRF